MAPYTSVNISIHNTLFSAMFNPAVQINRCSKSSLVIKATTMEYTKNSVMKGSQQVPTAKLTLFAVQQS